MTHAGAGVDPSRRPVAPGVLLSLAPSPAAAADLPVLLRAAIDAEQVGAGRLHLPAGLSDPVTAVEALRAHTRLLITAEPGDPATEVCDRPGPSFVEIVLDPGDPADLVAAVARIAGEATASGRVASVSGRGTAEVPVLLAALAAGLQVRAGTADTPPGAPAAPGSASARPDVALIARAAGLARIAGRPTVQGQGARELLGIGGTSAGESGSAWNG